MRYVAIVDGDEIQFSERDISGAELISRIDRWDSRYSLWWDRHATRATNRHVPDGPALPVGDSQHIELGKTPLVFFTLPPYGF
jgi:hypothetical protein